MFDAHAHLQDNKLINDLPEHIRRAKAAGVDGIVCCGCEEGDWPLVERIRNDYPGYVAASFGLHPYYIRKRSDDWLTLLERQLLAGPSAVGEFGLDFAIEQVDEKDQREVFIAQLKLAKNLSRPVSIHCRRAWRALEEVLNLLGPIPAGGLVHSFSGTPEMAAMVCRANLSVSFSGSLTRPKNKKTHRALLAVPRERLLFETDSPDLMPAGHTGQTNVPANLSEVVAFAAELLELPVEQVERISDDNTLRIFGDCF
ncbi:MAG: TatD family hydrolase [Candidatus Omnitrophota bacterium]